MLTLLIKKAGRSLRYLASPSDRREQQFLAAIRTEIGRVYGQQFLAWTGGLDRSSMRSLRDWERDAFDAVMDGEFLKSWEQESGVPAAGGSADMDAPVRPALFDALASFHLRRRVGRLSRNVEERRSGAASHDTPLQKAVGAKGRQVRRPRRLR